MAQKCALIVDDSRTARQVLGQVLLANEVRVETAASAEEALEFLSRSRPDVIFMDHMMPGMDGLQAVRAIKNNPATATIPIMMYTSQEGELYVGQARALGAVGVLPKQIKPVEVSELLRSLHLTDHGENISPAPAEALAPAEDPGKQAIVPAARDWPGLHRWLEHRFDQHSQDMRAEIEAALARAVREHAPAVPPATEPVRPGRPVLTSLLVLLLLGLAGVFFALHLDTQRKWRAAVDQNAQLMAAVNSRRTAIAASTTESARQLDARREQISDRFGDFISALEWSVNQSAAYPPGAEPFDAQRLETLRGLLDRLSVLGFTGLVQLDSYVGDFCYATDVNDNLVLAPADLPAEQCTRIGLPAQEARAFSSLQSVPFANFLATRAGDFTTQIEVVPHGNAAPLVPYPVALQGLTAGEWNAIARQNNRVSFTLVPDSPAR